MKDVTYSKSESLSLLRSETSHDGEDSINKEYTARILEKVNTTTTTTATTTTTTTTATTTTTTTTNLILILLLLELFIFLNRLFS